MSFNVGDEVVCVDAGSHQEWAGNRGKSPPLLTGGAHYFIEAMGIDRFGDLLLRLRDTAHPYDARRFRKIDPRAIALFRAMCASNKPLVEV